MICERDIRAEAFILLAVFPPISAAKSSHPRPFKAHTRFLATSTCIRGTWGQNLDVYLAEIVPKKSGEPVLVRLVDEYRNLDPPLSVDALTSATGTTLHVRRDQQCDMPYGRMQLRTAPGDPMAIVLERLGYTPPLQRTPLPSEVMPCYRPVRR